MPNASHQILAALDRLLAEAPPGDLPALAAALAARQSAVAARLLEKTLEGKTDSPAETFLTVPEAADRLKVSADWIYRRSRKLPFLTRLPGGQIRISSRALDQWIARQGARIA